LGLTGCTTLRTSVGTPAEYSRAVISPASLTFSAVTTGDSSAAQSITITNSGTASLNISGITQSGDFSQTASTCTATLAIGASCQVSVIFAPTAVGTRIGTLTLAGNGSRPDRLHRRLFQSFGPLSNKINCRGKRAALRYWIDRQRIGPNGLDRDPADD